MRKTFYTMLSLLTATLSISGCGAANISAHKSSTVQKVAEPAKTENTPIQTPTLPPATPAPTPTLTPSPVPTPIPTPSPVPTPEAVTQNSTPKSILEGKTLYIDPGHQGKANYQQEPIAPGAQETKEKMTLGTAGVATGVPEYKLNLQVSLKLKAVLEAQGAKVLMSRETNEVDLGNVERAKAANASGAQLVVRIHADGVDNHSVRGISILTPGAKYINAPGLIKNSKLAAELMLKNVISATGAVSRGVVARDDMTGFNWSTLPVVLIEMGFMTNETEDRLMNSDDYQKKLVNGMVKGIEEYFSCIQ